jgi:acyl-CoA reductase-like NAD-dependent aldehyde dehydrogenase
MQRRSVPGTRRFISNSAGATSFGWPTISLVMAPKTQFAFEVSCPDCGAILKIDPATGAVIAHTPAPRKKTFEDFETAAKAMREQDERRESLFRQAVDAEKNKNDVLEKKFAEALRKAKETPDTGKPLRDFDLD